jgi:hypothetical protein
MSEEDRLDLLAVASWALILFYAGFITFQLVTGKL